MKQFLFLLLKTALGVTFFLAIWLWINPYSWTVLEAIQPRTWLWGDSQIFTGIEQDEWHGDNPLFSQALHGTGFQDMLIFSERIPKNAEVVVGFGPLYYRLNNDRNMAGISARGVQSLFEAWQSEAFRFNLASSLLFNMQREFSLQGWHSNEHRYYGDSNKIGSRDWFLNNLDKLCETQEFEPIYELKDRWLMASLDEINQRTGNLTILSLPLVPQASETRFRQVIKHYESILDELEARYDLNRDTLTIDFDINPFYDATHLTHSSAKKATTLISERISETSEHTILIVQYRYPEDVLWQEQ